MLCMARVVGAERVCAPPRCGEQAGLSWRQEEESLKLNFLLTLSLLLGVNLFCGHSEDLLTISWGINLCVNACVWRLLLIPVSCF